LNRFTLRDSSLDQRILSVAVSAHTVFGQILLGDVHPEDQNGNQTKI
jgi:hypothetical protein